MRNTRPWPSPGLADKLAEPGPFLVPLSDHPSDKAHRVAFTVPTPGGAARVVANGTSSGPGTPPPPKRWVAGGAPGAGTGPGRHSTYLLVVVWRNMAIHLRRFLGGAGWPFFWGDGA